MNPAKQLENSEQIYIDLQWQLYSSQMLQHLVTDVRVPFICSYRPPPHLSHVSTSPTHTFMFVIFIQRCHGHLVLALAHVSERHVLHEYENGGLVHI